MTWDDVVRLAHTLPGVAPGTSYGAPALKVNGKLLTRLRAEDDSVVLLDVPPDERELLLHAQPDIFHLTPHYENYPTVLARLSRATDDLILTFLKRRWRTIAPKRTLRAFDVAS